MSIMTLKQQRLAELREDRRVYGHTAEAMEAIGMHWAAREYRQIAIDRCAEIERVRDRLSSRQLRKMDKEYSKRMARLYPDAVELF